MPDDPDLLPPPRPRRPAEDDAPRLPKSITCECCGSVLARDGGVMVLGDRARKMARSEAKIDDLDAQIAALKTERDTLAANVARLTADDDDDDASDERWM